MPTDYKGNQYVNQTEADRANADWNQQNYGNYSNDSPSSPGSSSSSVIKLSDDIYFKPQSDSGLSSSAGDYLLKEYKAAFASYNAKDFDNAIQHCNSVIDNKSWSINDKYYGKFIVSAYSLRGVCHLEKGNIKQAEADIEKADDYGDENAKKNLVRVWIARYSEGIKLKPNDPTNYRFRGGYYCDVGEYDKAFADCKKAIELGDTLKQSQLEKIAKEIYYHGYHNFNGINRPVNKAEGIKWFTKAAELGNAEAQNSLGDCYSDGKGVPQDQAEAVKWWRKAAEQGYISAQKILGDCYFYGKGVPQDQAEGMKWWKKAADMGNDADTQCLLGMCYMDGDGVPQDYKIAAEWFRKSAEQGNMYAQCELGNSYYNGNGVPKDLTKAAEWYLKSAEQGNDTAQNNIGYAYQHGEGVPQNFAEAVKWYTKAAEQGNDAAQNNIGYAYQYGEGVKQDYAKAREWYEKAIENGNVTPYRNLGVLYRDGLSVKQDFAKAEELLNKAIAAGNQKAPAELAKLKQMRGK